MNRFLAIASACVLIFASALAALADDDKRGDHDDARHAREAAAALPLVQLLPQVEREFGGQVIEVEFEREDGDYVYEFKLLTPDGYRIEVLLDAATGEVIETEGWDRPSEREDD